MYSHQYSQCRKCVVLDYAGLFLKSLFFSLWSEQVNIALRRFLHDHGDRRKPDYALLLSNDLRVFHSSLHDAIDNTAHSSPFNRLVQCTSVSIYVVAKTFYLPWS